MVTAACLTSDCGLDLQHTILLLTWNDKLYCAPLEKQSPRVLDVGCGTGIWSVDIGISDTNRPNFKTRI